MNLSEQINYSVIKADILDLLHTCEWGHLAEHSIVHNLGYSNELIIHSIKELEKDKLLQFDPSINSNNYDQWKLTKKAYELIKECIRKSTGSKNV